MHWTKELFNHEKPIIAMCHLKPLPNDPQFDESMGINYIIESALHDIHILQSSGIHGILISNEFSYPYTQRLSQITVATMARIIGEIKGQLKIPFGVDCMYDAFSTIDLAVATDADFYRITLPNSTIYEYEFGETQLGDILRYAMQNGLRKAKKVININSLINLAISNNNIEKLLKTITIQAQPDALCVSAESVDSLSVNGYNTCFELSKSVALLCDGGCNEKNITHIIDFIDGAIVGTSLKENQNITNPISHDNVNKFMNVVNSLKK